MDETQTLNVIDRRRFASDGTLAPINGNGHIHEVEHALREMPVDMRVLHDSIKQQIKTLETSELLARYRFARQAGLTFDGARDEYQIFGYDRVVTTRQYRDEYLRGGIAGRVVDALPNATWRGQMEIIEDESKEDYTPFEQAWADLDKRLQIQAKLSRVDKLAGLSTYAVLLIGARGDLSTELPKARKPEDLLYLTPFSGGGGPSMNGRELSNTMDTGDASIQEFDTNIESPRFGLPLYYRLKRTDLTMALAKPVHWTRVIHIAENLLDDEVYGLPTLERVWNLLVDLRKVTGGGAEAFWLRANQGMHIDIDKDLTLSPDQYATVVDKLKEQSELYKHQLTRWLQTRGVKATPLGSDVANFNAPADAILTQIAGAKSIPKRILTGSEMGELASSQDRDNWKDQINGRQTGYAGPYIVRPLVDRLITYGYLPAPKEDASSYEVRWPHIQTLTEEEKAKGAQMWAGTAVGSDPVFTDAEIRDKWYGMAPLTDEQRQEIADRAAEKIQQQQEAMAAAAPPAAQTEDNTNKKVLPFQKRAAESADDELALILREAIDAGAVDVVHAIIGLKPKTLGGEGSGNFGHEGRPGEVGGSSSDGGSVSLSSRVPKSALDNRGDRYEYLYHSGGRAGKPGYDAFFGNKEFTDAFPNEFGDQLYRVLLPPNVKILDLNKATPVQREFFAKMAEKQWPEDTAFREQVRKATDDDMQVGSDLYDSLYELWTDKSLTMAVMRETGIPVEGARFQGEYLLKKELISRLQGKDMRSAGGPGSGNFGHAGRPGEVGGSAGDISVPQLTKLFESAKAAHTEFEKSTGKPDHEWSAWYAGHISEKLGGKISKEELTKLITEASVIHTGADWPQKYAEYVKEHVDGGEANPTDAGMQAILHEIGKPDGGFTYQPLTGEQPKTGFALSVHKGHERVLDVKDLSVVSLAKYVKDNMTLLSKSDNFLGGWHNPADHKVYLDISTVVKTAAEAERMGRAASQIAYFDLSKGISVNINQEHQRAAESDAHTRGTEGRSADTGGSDRVVAQADRTGTDSGGDRGSQENPPIVNLGGEGSGNFGHAGRPGEVGGSAGSGSTPLGHTVPNPFLPDVVELIHPREKMAAKTATKLHGALSQIDGYLSDPDISHELWSILSSFTPESLRRRVKAMETGIQSGNEYMPPKREPMLDRAAASMTAEEAFNRILKLLADPEIGPALLQVFDRAMGSESWKQFLEDTHKLRSAGGEGSGNFGHAGRPGEVGGSSTEGVNAAPVHALAERLGLKVVTLADLPHDEQNGPRGVGGISFSAPKLPPKPGAVEGLEQGFKEVQQRYPELYARATKDLKIGWIDEGNPGVAASTSPNGDIIVFNSDQTADFPDVTPDFVGNVTTNVVKGMTGEERTRNIFRATAIHELGHVIDHATGSRLSAVAGLMTALQYGSDEDRFAFDFSKFSAYSGTSPAELFAEVFLADMTGQHYPEYFKKMMGDLKR